MVTTRWRRLALVLVATVALPACGTGTTAGPTTPAADGQAPPAATAATAGAPDCGLAPVGDSPPEAATPPAGDALPAVTLAGLDDCAPVSTADWIGEPLVLNFWASWCAPCRAEMPDLAAVAERLEGRVRFIGITHEDAVVNSRAFLREVPVPYDNFIDANGHDLFRDLGARATPTTMLVDAEGTVVMRHAGPITRDALTSALAEHLGVTAASQG